MRIVQLSDLHLLAEVGRRTWTSDPWANLDRVLAAVRSGPEVARLVLTGDLATQRRPETYGLLRERVAPWLDRLRVVPGNHDGRALLAAAFADRVTMAARSVVFVDDVGSWRLIGLDSLRRYFVHGRLGDAQRQWLVQQLRTERRVLLFVHHPPARIGTWWLDKDRLRDRAALATIVRGSPVRAIFCGHVHQERRVEFAGVPLHTTPSTAYQFAPGSWLPGPVSAAPAFRVIDVDDDGDRVATSVVRL